MANHENLALIRISLVLLHQWARAKRLIITEKATLEHQALGYDVDDVLDAILDTDERSVRAVSADDRFPERTVVVMHLRVEGRSLYAKISLRIDQDHGVTLLSFHKWGA